ncbi:hypothetical protein J5N97_017401 [Dioscorea zingiberensis]|uniref:Uncharacterized protein n=1 Tax=Dioscorea zingiberensis TaxID=325984 RepID=A0A9D5HG38_9LILI|nr:hypothetical protein J5N97_017401 [Dioscorea zingiberensis]
MDLIDTTAEMEMVVQPCNLSSLSALELHLVSFLSLPGSDHEPREGNTHEEGLATFTLLFQCVEAIEANKFEKANHLLLMVSEFASPFATSAQRVAAYFFEAMGSYLIRSQLGINHASLPVLQHQRLASASQVFNGISPFIKFSHFTANQAIQEAIKQEDQVHIIDLDIMQGLQWPGLFHILASRPRGPPRVRLTGLGLSAESLKVTGKRLSDFAEALRLPFEFRGIAEKVGNLNLESIGVSGKEAVAVNWLHHSLYDVSASDHNTLSLLQSYVNRLKPKVVTMVEQEINKATRPFLERFTETIHYYSAMFDCLAETHDLENESRYIVEHDLLRCEIRNLISGPPGRTGEGKFDRWRVKLSESGFRSVSLARNPAAQAALLLEMFHSDGCYTLVEENGMLKLGWKDFCLLTASAWEFITY